MKEYLHFSSEESNILFKGWSPKSYMEMLGAVIAIFLFSILYEFFKEFRERVNEKCTSRPSRERVHYDEDAPLLSEEGHADQTDSSSWLTQVYRSILHMVNMVMGYMIMLVVMTYNTWLFIGVILGCGLGYFIMDICRQRRIANKAVRDKKDQASMNTYGTNMP